MNIRLLAAAILSCSFAAPAAHADDIGRQIAEQGNRALHEIRAEAGRALAERLRSAIAPSALASQLQRPLLTSSAQSDGGAADCAS
jgi:dephospho-CoA kinase